MCPRSAFMGFWCLARRRMMAKQMSKMGMPSIRKGTAKEMMAYSLNIPWMDKEAKINPRNVEPVSPIKILAGLKL